MPFMLCFQVFLRTRKELLVCSISQREFSVILSTTSRMRNNLKRNVVVVLQVVILQDPRSLQNLKVCD